MTQRCGAHVSGTGWGAAAENWTPVRSMRVEGGSHGGADVLEGAPVSVGDEDHGDIGSAAAEGLEDVADHLTGGVGGERVLGERRGEGHAWTVSRRAGEACTAPR